MDTWAPRNLKKNSDQVRNNLTTLGPDRAELNLLKRFFVFLNIFNSFLKLVNSVVVVVFHYLS